MMTEETIITAILDEAFFVHREMGPGLLENVYQTCLAFRLEKRGLIIETEKAVPVYFENVKMKCGFRANILVENRVVIETKAIDDIAPVHIARTLTYLRFLDLRYGLILNFNNFLLKDGIKRVVRGYGKKI